jgi:cytochrome c oxidase subunit 2
MRGHVVVMTPAEYAEWLAGGEDQPPASAGEELFARYRCDTCHFQGGQARCPSLSNLFGQPVRLADGSTVVADEAYLRESILNPAAKVVAGYPTNMPTFQGQLTEEQVFHLIEYIKSLNVMPAETGHAPVEAPSQGTPPTEESRDR